MFYTNSTGGTIMNNKTYKVGEVAKLAGISIRTLRYYDSIDLLKPSRILKNGHRQYDLADVERLQLILGLKLLDFSLVDIKEYLTKPDINLVDILTYQKELLQRKIKSYTDINEKIDFIVTHYKEDDSNRMNDIFSIYEMMQIVNHNEISKKYFSEQKQNDVLSHVDHQHDYHEALDKSIMILAKDMTNMSESDKSFVSETFLNFITTYFDEVNEKTISKTAQMLVEMIDSDKSNRIVLSEVELYGWLIDQLIDKGDK